MNMPDERSSFAAMTSEDIKKLCASDYKRFYGLRTDIRELIHVMVEIHHEMKLQNKRGAI